MMRGCIILAYTCRQEVITENDQLMVNILLQFVRLDTKPFQHNWMHGIKHL